MESGIHLLSHPTQSAIPPPGPGGLGTGSTFWRRGIHFFGIRGQVFFSHPGVEIPEFYPSRTTCFRKISLNPRSNKSGLGLPGCIYLKFAISNLNFSNKPLPNSLKSGIPPNPFVDILGRLLCKSGNDSMYLPKPNI